MKWNVTDNDPPLVGRGYRVIVDGAEVSRVVAFDTEAGWVECHDLPLRLTDDRAGVVTKVLRGNVELVPPSCHDPCLGIPAAGTDHTEQCRRQHAADVQIGATGANP